MIYFCLIDTIMMKIIRESSSLLNVKNLIWFEKSNTSKRRMIYFWIVKLDKFKHLMRTHNRGQKSCKEKWEKKIKPRSPRKSTSVLQFLIPSILFDIVQASLFFLLTALSLSCFIFFCFREYWNTICLLHGRQWTEGKKYFHGIS